MQASYGTYCATIFEGWQMPEARAAYQAFRKYLFVDDLGWRLDHRQGIEYDEFDTDNAIYCLLYHQSSLIGGWRAIRTTNDYLAKRIFPELATLRPYPSRRDVWEISRLGVMPEARSLLAGQLIYALMVEFARTRKASSIIGVVDVVHGRVMSRSGMKLRRCGTTQTVGFDKRGRKISAFLAELQLAEQGGEQFDRLMETLKHLEISDEALSSRPERIPA